MADLAQFSVNDLAQVAEAVQEAGAHSSSMEECATGIVRSLFNDLTDSESGRRACVLVRFFKTQAFANLPRALQASAQDLMNIQPLDSEMKCLVLLASAGERGEWNTRHRSKSHKAIPLPSPEIVARSPMISQLLAQLGVDVSEMLSPSPEIIINLQERTFNVFYIEDAHDSPHIPEQDEFVIPYGIKSVLGFGGVLGSGELFVVVLFTRVHVPRETAELFNSLALSAKTALLRFDWGPIFREQAQFFDLPAQS